MNQTLRVHKIIEETIAEGPGLRFAFWVQGCSLCCEGCFEEHTWDKNLGEIIEVNELIKFVSKDTIEGVTVLGGEPFEQAESMSIFLKKCKELGKNTIVFSGHTYEELQELNDYVVLETLKYTDVLIDGRYDKYLSEKERPMVGSTNQRFIALSAIGESLIKRIGLYTNKVEIRITKDGVIMINGMWK